MLGLDTDMNVNRQFPSLQSAFFQPLSGEVEVNYKSGASFRGQVLDYKKIGRGIFTWPNGARYEGEYEDNVRTGKGIQLWSDGSQYEGQFQNDLRHGEGEHIWTNREKYNGKFFKDHRHGNGAYTWPDGSTFKGTFYMDRKEGYGIFTFANGNQFEGLYKEDEREGPGVMTYPDHTQDVGLWHGEKLIKMCTAIPNAFAMKKHPDFDFDPKEHVQYLDLNDPSGQEAFENNLKDANVYQPDSNVTEKVTNIFNIALDPRSLAVNKESFDNEFYPKSEGKKKTQEKVKVWNKTPSLIAMQKHSYKHLYGKKSVSYSVDKILSGDRSKFGNKGPIELASEELIKAATEGNVNKVEDLLNSGNVSPDVADSNGNTVLLAASVNWHIDVINSLLNHGADVNKLSDEGCSALAAACIFFYPKESFLFNIAERYLEKQKDVQLRVNVDQSKQPQQQSSQGPHTPKSILSKRLTGSKKGSNMQIQEDLLSDGTVSGNNDDESGKDVKDCTHKKQQFCVENSNCSKVTLVTDTDKDLEEFDSNVSLKYYKIEISDQLIERCATQLSMNEKVVSRKQGYSNEDLGTARNLAVLKNERERMKLTLDLLLRRGADPNASSVPMPVLFFAIKAADVDMVKLLLAKNASTITKLPKQKGGLSPLHIAAAIPGEEGVLLTELLLKAGADPNVRAKEDDSFLNKTLMEEWNKDPICAESQALLGGRTPLHIACARDDDYKNITRVVHLLLQHGANSSLLCNGFSPLALCITSGNDMSVDELLVFGNDVSLPLTHGVGSALCASTNTQYEHRRPLSGRLNLIDKLVRAGANVLAPIFIGPKRNVGTVVDYAYYIFNQDSYIAKTPYHALTHSQRETFINRRKLLEHIGDILRTKAVEREKRRLDDEQRDGVRSVSPSSGFVYIGAGAPLPPDAKIPKSLQGQIHAHGDAAAMVKFDSGLEKISSLLSGDTGRGKVPRDEDSIFEIKPLFRYCYQCGRSVFVRLSACTRCKEVYYCSKACKLKAWNARHKDECIRIGGKSRSPSPTSRQQLAESPTSATYPDKGRRTTVSDLNKDRQAIRMHVSRKGLSLSASSKKSKDLPWKTVDGHYIDNYSFV